LDILLNNAGVLVQRGIEDPQAQQLFRQVMDVNLHGVFAMVQASPWPPRPPSAWRARR
jgi:NAD(P)-dependent dehydrogenase (short-subunit alcohol dehydrogenase family)